MTFEQPASLNRYIFMPVPFTWALRWKLFKHYLPAASFILILAFPNILLQEWVADHWRAAPFLKTFGAALLLSVPVPFQFELALWIGQKCKRIIKLEADYVWVGRGLAQRTRWRNIRAWQFNDVPEESNYRIATVEYISPRKKQRRHSIVLNKSEIDRLISELKFRQQKNGFTFSILENGSNRVSSSIEFRQVNPAILYTYFVGAFFFLEGTFFLIANFGAKDDSFNRGFSPNLNSSFARFVKSHFATVPEYRHFFVHVGGALFICGFILLIWSHFLFYKEKARNNYL